MISTWVFSIIFYCCVSEIAQHCIQTTLQNLAPNTRSMFWLYVVLVSFPSIPFSFVPTGLRCACIHFPHLGQAELLVILHNSGVRSTSSSIYSLSYSNRMNHTGFCGVQNKLLRLVHIYLFYCNCNTCYLSIFSIRLEMEITVRGMVSSHLCTLGIYHKAW